MLLLDKYNCLLIPFAEFFMNEDENTRQEKANASDNYVHNADERVLSTQPRRVRYDEAFGPFESHHGKFCSIE